MRVDGAGRGLAVARGGGARRRRQNHAAAHRRRGPRGACSDRRPTGDPQSTPGVAAQRLVNITDADGLFLQFGQPLSQALDLKLHERRGRVEVDLLGAGHAQPSQFGFHP